MPSFRTLSTGLARAASWFSAEKRAMPAAGGGAFLPAPVLSGVGPVTPETALTFTAVFSAINVLSTDVGSMPLRVHRSQPHGGKVEVPRDPRYDLVYCEPNEDTTAIRFRTAQMGHVLGWGNSYAEIERLNSGMPAALHLLSPRPGDTRPDRTRDGRLVYLTEGGRGPTLAAEDVLHVAGLGWDGLTGYSPLAFARQAIGLGMAAEQSSAAFFGNGSMPRGALKTPNKLTKDAMERLRENWERVHQGPANANRVAILEQGLEWQNTTINATDAQFLESRKFQVVEIARIYNLPPHKIGDYSQAHLANLEESNLDYLNTTLGPWLVAIEQEFNRKLFTFMERRRGLHVMHDQTALLRGNMLARANWASTLFNMAAISPDEVRGREGMNPLAGGVGEKTYRPLNMAPLGEEDPAEPAAPTEPAPPPPDDPTPTDEAGGDAAGKDEA